MVSIVCCMNESRLKSWCSDKKTQAPSGAVTYQGHKLVEEPSAFWATVLLTESSLPGWPLYWLTLSSFNSSYLCPELFKTIG